MKIGIIKMHLVIRKSKRYKLSIAVFLFIGLLLSMVQLKVDNPLIILERFIDGGGWIEIGLVAFYGGFLFGKMHDPGQSARWRRISWALFSLVFFTQLLLGLVGFDKFLMTGELHLPVPAMILSGPLYRGELSFMTFLFLSTVVLTGPAWCSHLCYFGGIDNLAAKGKVKKSRFVKKHQVKHVFLLLTILVTLILRIFEVNRLYALVAGIAAGLVGVIFILFFSLRTKKMAQCTLYCPIGTVVRYLKYINPFRMYIESTACTECMLCSKFCKYDALNFENIAAHKPGATCTYCGDCIDSCKDGAIRYKFFNLEPEKARNLYLFLTVSFHVVFLALAKI